jgi:hypothetical protein
MRFALPIVVLTALSGGCAVGQKIAYHDLTPALVARAPIPLTVVVQDERPEVSTLKKDPQFVGLMRGGWGNAFDVETASGKPLADDITSSISRGLALRGFNVSGASVLPMSSPAQIVATLAPTGASRVLVIQLSRWKSDTYMGTKLEVDVTARVLEVPSARELGVSRVAGARNLGSSFWDPPGHAESVVPGACRETIEQLLNSPTIVAALSVTAVPPPTTAPDKTTNTGPGPGAGPASVGRSNAGIATVAGGPWSRG